MSDFAERLCQAGEIIGISVIDHVIISKRGYYSFLEEGNDSLLK